MVLYMVGLGLGDEDDITVKGLKVVQSADVVFLEAYTSILGVDKERLEQVYNKTITVADRDLCEQQAEEVILTPALQGKAVAFLVVGDPVCATTHTDLWLRARQIGVDVQIIHNTSIMGAAGATGLQLYNFGHTVSIPFFEENWRPISFVSKIQYNRQGGMHTLCLLDIKVKEPDFQAMIKGQIRYLPPRFMSIRTAAEQLLEAAAAAAATADNNKEDETDQHHNNHPQIQKGVAGCSCSYDGSKTLCVGLARMGQVTQQIVAGTLQELLAVEFGAPLHSLIICGELHDLELQVLREFLVPDSTFDITEHRPPKPPPAQHHQQQKKQQFETTQAAAHEDNVHEKEE